MNNLGIWENYPSNLYTVGDIHGDYKILEHILVDLAKVCYLKKNRLIWKENNNDWVIFCGDLIDRLRKKPGKIMTVDDEDSDKKIIMTLINLNKYAEKYGGKIIILLGNHELLNFEHAFDYVSTKGSYDNRQLDFTRGSPFAKIIAENTFLSVKIKNWVFVHGGFCPEAFKNNDYLHTNPIGKLNTLMKKFLMDKNFFLNKHASTPEKIQMKTIVDALYGINENKSPLNCRHYGVKIHDNDQCEQEVINEVFKYIFKDKDKDKGKMVISHTPQFIYNMNINKTCNGRVWRLDTGMSRGFDEHHELIENMIKDNGIKMINQLKLLIEHDLYRYASILKINDNCEEIVTKYVYARDKIENRRIENSEAIFTKYRLIDLIDKIKSNKLKLNANIENQKDDIIKNLEWIIKFLDEKKVNFIKNKDHNICLIDYD